MKTEKLDVVVSKQLLLWCGRCALVLILLVLGGCSKPERYLKPELRIDLGSGVSMDFVLIRPGVFMMGSTNTDNMSLVAKPAHQVRISKHFYLAKCEVTQEQWELVMGENPSPYRDKRYPVESISWDDCQHFIEKLEVRVSGMVFCLPTEAQWEYACRAGSTGDYCYGDGDAALGNFGWYSVNSDGRPHHVGEKNPNAWGLYDMHGNVFEWCADWYGDKYYANSPRRDPEGPLSGKERIARGGSYRFPSPWVKSYFRMFGPPDARNNNCGMRVCIVGLD